MLLRVSEFCQQKVLLTNNNNSNTATEENEEEEQQHLRRRIPIQAKILSKCHYVPTNSTTSTSITTDIHKSSNGNNDKFCTIYTSDKQLLCDLQMFHNTACILSSYSMNEWCVVILQYMPLGEIEESLASNSTATIYIPPCIGASIGIYSYNTPSSSRSYNGYIISSKDLKIKIAKQLTLKELAPHPKVPNLLLSKKENKDGGDEHIRNYFNKLSRFVTVHSIIGIIQTSSSSNQPHRNTSRDSVRFFKVVDLENESNTQEEEVNFHNRCNNDRHCYYIGSKISSDTTRIIISTNKENYPYIMPRLPCLPITFNFIKSTTTTTNTTTNGSNYLNYKHDDDAIIVAPPYPKYPSIINALLQNQNQDNERIAGNPPSMMTIVGDDEKDCISDCLSHAAEVVGMRYLPIDGLASFYYRCNNNSKNRQAMHYTGSTYDKIQGIRYAIKLAKESIPCLLHLQHFHQEISTVEEDDSNDNDDISRLLSTMRQELSNSFDYVSSTQTTTTTSNTISSIQIVISTQYPFPLLQASIPITIQLSSSGAEAKPEFEYAKYLWQYHHHHDRSYATFLNNDKRESIITNDQIRSYLLGRSANEIITLKSNYLKQQQQITIDQFFQDYNTDEKKINPISSSSSTNTNTTSLKMNIPKVSWDDIGGLVHVKNEIWNDITLPMILLSSSNDKNKESTLNGLNVQKSRYRRGFILYGPPGSGKTMVAKAIATTCKLPFINIKGPELLGSYVGESEFNIRNVFSLAKKQASLLATTSSTSYPGAIIFFDEMDSIAPNTNDTSASSSQNAIMNRIVTTLLLELDKCNNDESCFIFVIGATNRPDLLHSSLLRPGRFDRRIYLGCMNDIENMSFILKACMRTFTFEEGWNVEDVIREIMSFVKDQKYTGADLANITKIGLKRSIRRICSSIEHDICEVKQQQLGCSSSSDYDNDEEEEVIMDQVMDQYSEKGILQPIVTIQDLIDAIREVVPSVKDDDLKHYESLRDEYSSSN